MTGSLNSNQKTVVIDDEVETITLAIHPQDMDDIARMFRVLNVPDYIIENVTKVICPDI